MNLYVSDPSVNRPYLCFYFNSNNNNQNKRNNALLAWLFWWKSGFELKLFWVRGTFTFHFCIQWSIFLRLIGFSLGNANQTMQNKTKQNRTFHFVWLQSSFPAKRRNVFIHGFDTCSNSWGSTLCYALVCIASVSIAFVSIFGACVTRSHRLCRWFAIEFRLYEFGRNDFVPIYDLHTAWTFEMMLLWTIDRTKCTIGLAFFSRRPTWN